MCRHRFQFNLPEFEMKVLERDLDFASFQKKIIEPDLKWDFQEFCGRLKINWNFLDKPFENFSEFLSFQVKTN